MPRRLLMMIASLAVLAVGVSVDIVANRPPPETTWHGRRARYWLGEVFTGQQRQALQAFSEMGTNADPVLLAAFAGREDLFSRALRPIYIALPWGIRKNVPAAFDQKLLRDAAVIVVMNMPSKSLVSKIVPLVKEPDSEKRRDILISVEAKIGPMNGDLVPFFVLTCDDPAPYVRSMTAFCLGRIGPSAAPAVPAVLELCADTNLEVRATAAKALWKITLQTNAAVPVLYGVLNQTTDSGQRHWAACYLAQMKVSDPLLMTTFISSLTNTGTGVRMSACACLGQFGPAAKAAIPALHNALNDPDAEVRRRAEAALAQIEPNSASGGGQQ